MKVQKTPIALAFALMSTVPAFAPSSVEAAPTGVSFKQPLAGAQLSGSISQTAACEVTGTNIKRVVFSIVSSSGAASALNTETGAPWNCNINTKSFADGSYTLRAVAYDAANTSVTVTRNVTIKNNTTTPPVTPPSGGTNPLPVVSFSKPASGVNLPVGATSCAVSATDADGIAKLEWYLDGKLVNTELQTPYDTCNFNLTAGSHELKAVATDKKGVKGEAKITVTAGSTGGTPPANTPPTVGITSPTAGTKLSGSSGAYQATASDTGGSVAKVEMFLVSGTTQKMVDSKIAAPYTGTINTAGVPNGAAMLRAVATDNLGATSQTDRAVTIDNTVTPPPNPDPAPGPGTGTTLPLNGARAVATFESLGLYWKPGSNPGAAGCNVRYRKHSESAWKQGLALWYDSRNAECRGSLVHLTPGTDYAVEMGAGSSAPTTGVNVKTWSENFPIAQTINVASGSGTLNITQGGTASGYVLYQGPATLDANNAVDYNVVISAPYVIVRGLTLKGARRDGLKLLSPAHDVVIEDNDISGWGRPSTQVTPDGWTVQVDGDSGISANCWGAVGPWLERTVIQRNKIHDPRYGANSWSDGHPKGANGVWFNDCGGNHVFRYNEIYAVWGKWFMDGFGGWENHSVKGTPNSDSDLYGNVIRNVWDDAIEAEGANNNVRIWGNYMDQTATGIASTSTVAGPLYIWRNVWNRSRARSRDKDARLYMFKSGSSAGGGGRRYVFHNTMLQAPASAGSVYPDCCGTLTQGGTQGLAAPGGGQNLTNTVSRNNIFQIQKNWWSSVDDAGGGSPANDLDVDLVNGNVTAGAGAEPNRIVGVPIYKSGHGWTSDHGGNYQLEVGSPGLNAGVLLPNFNDAYTGSAPDVGAHEADTAAMKLGTSGSGAIWSPAAADAGGGTVPASTTPASTTSSTTGTPPAVTTSASSGVCSSASCVATQ